MFVATIPGLGQVMQHLTGPYLHHYQIMLRVIEIDFSE